MKNHLHKTPETEGSRFCLTEISVAWLIAVAVLFAALLWRMIVQVL